MTGGARYTEDITVPDLAHAVVVHAAIAKGRITAIDATRAERVPGVLRVVYHGNAPRLSLPTPSGDLYAGGAFAESLPLLQSDEIHYHGQIVAMVVAETIEAARHAARVVNVSYEEAPHRIRPLNEDGSVPDVAEAPESFYGEEAQSSRGDPESAFLGADYKVEATYTTPVEYHGAMELHATTAVWDGNSLTLYEPSQWVYGVRKMIAAAIGVSEEQVRVVSRFVGGAFGGKGGPKMHAAMTAAVARDLRRPIRLVQSREGVFLTCGLRPATVQTERLGADAGGKLVSVRHDTVNPTSELDAFVEAGGYAGRYLYACENHAVLHRVVPTNITSPNPMRAPGEGPGTYALESAMDELAHEMDMDPIKLRLQNIGDTDLHLGLPFSVNNIASCYRRGAEAFGWDERVAPHQAWRDEDGRLIGIGMASAAYPVFQFPSRASVTLHDDGTADLRCATHEIGTGTLTILAQLAAAELGLDPQKVRVSAGDTVFPRAPASVGALTVCSVAPAIEGAIEAALAELPEEEADVPFADRLRAVGRAQVSGEFETEMSPAWQTHSMKSFGAQFAEVRVDEATGEVRVARMLGAFDFGRVVNAKTATSQLKGGMVFGIGMALLEARAFDRATGRTLVHSFAEYLMPVHADVPEIDVIMLGEPDTKVNSIGAKGCGEISNTGIAAAIANAVFNATGKRVRDLPIRLERLVSGQSRQSSLANQAAVASIATPIRRSLTL